MDAGASITDLLEYSNEFPQWNITIFRAAQDWEIHAFTSSTILCTLEWGEMQTRLFGILLRWGSSPTVLTTSFSLQKIEIHSCGRTLGCGQSKGMADHYHELVLHEQKEWGVS